MKNKKTFITIATLCVLALGLFFFLRSDSRELVLGENKIISNENTGYESTALPISNAKRREVKKYFGIYISPQNSPISPERFTGFHTATDFEITEKEKTEEVPIYAFCDGKILRSENARGYGGMIVQSCNVKGEDLTVIYGHVSMKQTLVKIGETVRAGDKISLLAEGFSEESGGERKHLHFGIHKGSGVDTRGYVGMESLLEGWADPMDYL